MHYNLFELAREGEGERGREREREREERERERREREREGTDMERRVERRFRSILSRIYRSLSRSISLRRERIEN